MLHPSLLNQRIQFKDAASKNELLRLNEYRGAVQFADASGADKSIVKVQVMRCGGWEHPWYGTMLIMPTTLTDMVKNFKDNVRRQDLPIDYFHESDREAAGWVKDLYLSENLQELWADVKVTPKCAQMLADNEIRYFSADFYFEWTDPETNVSYKNVLNGGGFVNRPFIKDMQPVTELHEGNSMLTIEQAKQEITKLGESITAKDAEIKTLGEKVKEQGTEIATLKAEKAEAVKAKALADKEAKFAALCDEGKACAAQKDAFMKDDMVAFAELAQKLNVVVKKKAGETEDGEDYELSEEEKAMCEKFNLSEKEFRVANPKK